MFNVKIKNDVPILVKGNEDRKLSHSTFSTVKNKSCFYSS